MEVLARAAAVVIEPTVAAEALSRFPADWGMPPDAVFAEAHAVGRGDALEVQAVRQALAESAGVPGYVSVNLSPRVVLTERARRVLRRMAADRGGQAVPELSEHDAVADYDELRAVLAPLRTAGLRLAVDDVGAGFSSLRHIVVTAPDLIELDRSLVAGVGEDEVLATLARSLVDLAAGLGAALVAKGVETPADAERLRQLGVGYGQGWLFGRPVPAGEFAASYPTTAAAVPQPREPLDVAVRAT
jgi:EAL domain-containing protein (putative c-di-GMP-specific phosphodiesterase class I)